MKENPGQKVEDVNTHRNNETPSTGAEWQTAVDQERLEKVVFEHIHTQTLAAYILVRLCLPFSVFTESHKDPSGKSQATATINLLLSSQRPTLNKIMQLFRHRDKDSNKFRRAPSFSHWMCTCGMSEVERMIDYGASCPIIHPVLGREWLSTRCRLLSSRLAQN